MPHLGVITSQYNANEKERGAIEAVEKYSSGIAFSPNVDMKSTIDVLNISSGDGPTYKNTMTDKTSDSNSKKRKHSPDVSITSISKSKLGDNTSVNGNMINVEHKKKIQVTLHQCMEFYVTG